MITFANSKKAAELGHSFRSGPFVNGHEGTRRRPPSPVTYNLTTKLYLSDKHLILILGFSPTNYLPFPEHVKKTLQIMVVCMYVF